MVDVVVEEITSDAPEYEAFVASVFAEVKGPVESYRKAARGRRVEAVNASIAELQRTMLTVDPAYQEEVDRLAEGLSAFDAALAEAEDYAAIDAVTAEHPLR